MLKLTSWGLWPWQEFLLDPADWSYTRRRLAAEPASRAGYSGFGQELRVSGQGTMLFAVFVHAGDIVLLRGSEACSLFSPGLVIEHRAGALTSHLLVTTPPRESLDYCYRRTDLLQAILDPAYDDLDYELANLPAALPSLSQRKKEELVAEWAAHVADRPGARSGD